jgi:hypothetical protein
MGVKLPKGIFTPVFTAEKPPPRIVLPNNKTAVTKDNVQ